MVANSTRIALLEKNQASFHKKQSDSHSMINKVQLDVCDIRKDVNHVIEGLADNKTVIINNTKVIASLEIAFIRMMEQRETTKSNISILGKFIIWGGTVTGMVYGVYLWARGY